MTVTEYNRSVDEFADRLFRFIIKSVKDEDLANDIVQETYTRMWEKVKSVSYEKVRSYLFTAAYHIILNHFRSSKRVEPMEDVHILGYSHSEQYTDLKEVLEQALDQLPAVQRTVILLRDYEGYSYQEIAEITDLNESQVKVYIYRGRMALKERIGSIETLV
jgi:RNA polymerase sigma factor (sigma-70 family)